MKKSNFLTVLIAVAFLPVMPRQAGAKAFLALFLFSFLLITACGEEKTQIEAITQQTETIHDEAMKELAEMNRVARELKQTMIAAMMNPEQSAAYSDALTAMGKAENNMMDWMKNYKSPDSMPTSEAFKYLQEQKALIEKNRAEIRTALEEGKKLQGK